MAADEPERHELEEEPHDLVDFYATDNFAEVEILMDVLEDHGLQVYKREMEMGGLPTDVGDESEIRIVVQDNRLEDARALIEETVAEGPVPDQGRFLLDSSSSDT